MRGRVGASRRGAAGATRRLGKVCTTIAAKTAERMASKATTAFALGSDLVEFRIDLLDDPSAEAVGELSHFARRSVMTVRSKEEGGGFRGSEEERLELISAVGRATPLYLDVELRAVKGNPGWAKALPKDSHKIVSWHDFARTPETRQLERVMNDASAYGGIVKIVTAAEDEGDNWRVLRLYEDAPTELIAFCMGAHGTVSRLISLQLGSPIAYAALPNEQVAPGQLDVTTMVEMKKGWESRAW